MCGLGQYRLKPVMFHSTGASQQQCLRVQVGSTLNHDTKMVAA